ncbi:hydrolase 1, exosortase A system-associated [Pseudoduganella aquatica]|uniref:Hydrolase 1, exosortase A system-associated n=1 Tax=Pseudoduganella aquatica TaxID=2660641 RepID=A0A7X4HF67_9BURK|nr:hydrolase 1, exosortase A system-associated [Pseudoduganella aquatica]MYN10080.1 hydrolase 1, exosortase A system-associated [Pseudoduganella aquatica]
MQFEERALSFDCGGDCLFGVASVPAQPAERGVVVVVGGPQYRGGSHRQFTLLARHLAAQGIAVLRFDYRGMGDAEGEQRDFEMVAEDLRSAIGQFQATVPAVREVVLWGLCDGASAALFYAAQDARVQGVVLLNPWVRTEGGLAKATLKHYYRDRLLQPALWKKIFTGQFNYGAALRSFTGLLGAASGKPAPQHAAAAPTAAPSSPPPVVHAEPKPRISDPDLPPLPGRMHDSLAAFQGKVLLILSGADLTAQEFRDAVKASRPWQKLLAAPRVTHRELAQADHTFSRRAWRDQVADWTGEWMRSW